VRKACESGDRQKARPLDQILSQVGNAKEMFFKEREMALLLMI
jgi:hypothetical protein